MTKLMTARFWFTGIGLAGLVVGFGCGGSGGGGIGSGGPQDSANGMIGGRLYDKFWSEQAGWNQADGNISTFNAKADFFRCKQCHGWDQLGTLGSYINRKPNANRPNISSVNLRQVVLASSSQQLFDKIKSSAGRRNVSADLSTYHPATNPTVGDQMPNYGAFFSDAQIWHLVKFLKSDAIDTDLLYDSNVSGVYPTGTIAYLNIGKDGNAGRGHEIYQNRCRSCHGENGTAFLVDGNAFTVGRHLRSKPYEDQHKIKFGQLGSSMGSIKLSLGEMKDLYKALTNTGQYPD